MRRLPVAIARALPGLVAVALCVAPVRSAAPDVAPEVSIATRGGEIVKPGTGPGLTHLVFVARWCSPCETELQQLRRRASLLRHGNYRTVLVGVAQRQTGDEFYEWVRATGYEGPAVYDADGALQRAFGVEALPWHAVIGPGKKLLAAGDRGPEAAQLQRWLGSAP